MRRESQTFLSGIVWGAVIVVALVRLFGCQAPQPTQPAEPVSAPCLTWPPGSADCYFCVSGGDCWPADEAALVGWGKPGHLYCWCPHLRGCLAFGGPAGDTLSETCLLCWDADDDGDVDLRDAWEVWP